MAKEAYYFSHDSNARNDLKITAMRGVYGSEGYGWYWMLIEMMRESEGYALDMQGKYIWNAFASQLHGDCKTIEQYVHDCIHEFNLFDTDNERFWSPSLLRRMEIREQKSKVRSKAAKARWDKAKPQSDEGDENANDMQMHSNCNANGMQGKESKRKESKGKEIKEYKEHVHALVALLIELMLNNNPKAKIPDDLSKWLDAMDKIERLNGYTVDQIKAVIEWSQQDEFWKSNILSVPKLREKIDTLIMQMQRARKPVTNHRYQNKPFKPQIPIVTAAPAQQTSVEEMEELRALARKLDGKG